MKKIQKMEGKSENMQDKSNKVAFFKVGIFQVICAAQSITTSWLQWLSFRRIILNWTISGFALCMGLLPG